MPVEVISCLLSERDSLRRLQSQLVLQCAPLLKGIKVSAITNLPSHAETHLETVLGKTGISYRVLCRKREKILVLFYWKEAFFRHMNEEENQRFLKEYGYREGEMERNFDRLSARIETYSGTETVFPHEIGVFLAYPLADVKGFIRNQGKDYLLTGYWKVYQDPEGAKRMFRSYDEAKSNAVEEFLEGKPIVEIAVQAA